MADEGAQWLRWSHELGFQCDAPAFLTLGDRLVRFPAVVHGFGAKLGMVIAPDWHDLEAHTLELSNRGYGYACVSIDGADREGMKDLLSDWGTVA